MRVTICINDDLLRELNQRADAENISLTHLIDRLLREGLNKCSPSRPARPFRQKTYSMGQPALDLNRALTAAATLEDEEILHKLAMRLKDR